MTYTPEQIEWAARLLCAAMNVESKNRWHKDNLECARRLLAELERQGVKVTKAPEFPHNTVIEKWHDAAPICPDAGEGET